MMAAAGVALGVTRVSEEAQIACNGVSLLAMAAAPARGRAPRAG